MQQHISVDMHAWTHGCRDAKMQGCRVVDGWMDGWMDGRMDGWTDGGREGWREGCMLYACKCTVYVLCEAYARFETSYLDLCSVRHVCKCMYVMYITYVQCM